MLILLFLIDLIDSGLAYGITGKWYFCLQPLSFFSILYYHSFRKKPIKIFCVSEKSEEKYTGFILCNTSYTPNKLDISSTKYKEPLVLYADWLFAVFTGGFITFLNNHSKLKKKLKLRTLILCISK